MAAEPEYSRDFLLMALFTGMRRGELMRLRWENVDLAARTLHLPTTKNGDPLNLPLATYLADLLTKRKKQAGRSPFVFPGPGKDGHLVETKKFLLRVNTGSGSPSHCMTSGAHSSPSPRVLTFLTTP